MYTFSAQLKPDCGSLLPCTFESDAEVGRILGWALDGRIRLKKFVNPAGLAQPSAWLGKRGGGGQGAFCSIRNYLKVDGAEL